MESNNDKKCIYTNEPTQSTDYLFKRDDLGSLYSWVNKAPASLEYIKRKQKRKGPTELEMEAHRIFYLLELAKLEVVYLSNKLKEVQSRITGKKKDEIDHSYHMKHITEDFEKMLENKKIWDDEEE